MLKEKKYTEKGNTNIVLTALVVAIIATIIFFANELLAVEKSPYFFMKGSFLQSLKK